MMNSAASIKLIAMVLDDTLLDSRLSLSRRSITSIRKAYVGYHGTEAPWLNLDPVEASKIMILGEPERLAALLPLARETFQGRLRVTSSKPWFLELNHSAATKGYALKILTGILGLRLCYSN